MTSVIRDSPIFKLLVMFNLLHVLNISYLNLNFSYFYILALNNFDCLYILFRFLYYLKEIQLFIFVFTQITYGGIISSSLKQVYMSLNLYFSLNLESSLTN